MFKDPIIPLTIVTVLAWLAVITWKLRRAQAGNAVDREDDYAYGPRDVGRGPRDVGRGPRDVGRGPRRPGRDTRDFDPYETGEFDPDPREYRRDLREVVDMPRTGPRARRRDDDTRWDDQSRRDDDTRWDDQSRRDDDTRWDDEPRRDTEPRRIDRPRRGDEAADWNDGPRRESGRRRRSADAAEPDDAPRWADDDTRWDDKAADWDDDEPDPDIAPPVRDEPIDEPAKRDRGGLFRGKGAEVEINPGKCMRFAFCEHEAPEIFKLVGDRIDYKPSVPASQVHEAVMAAKICPARAIKVKVPGTKPYLPQPPVDDETRRPVRR